MAVYGPSSRAILLVLVTILWQAPLLYEGSLPSICVMNGSVELGQEATYLASCGQGEVGSIATGTGPAAQELAESAICCTGVISHDQCRVLYRRLLLMSCCTACQTWPSKPVCVARARPEVSPRLHTHLHDISPPTGVVDVWH